MVDTAPAPAIPLVCSNKTLHRWSLQTVSALGPYKGRENIVYETLSAYRAASPNAIDPAIRSIGTWALLRSTQNQKEMAACGSRREKKKGCGCRWMALRTVLAEQRNQSWRCNYFAQAPRRPMRGHFLQLTRKKGEIMDFHWQNLKQKYFHCFWFPSSLSFLVPLESVMLFLN